MLVNWFKSVMHRFCTAFTIPQWVILFFAILAFFYWAARLSVEREFVWAGVVLLASAAIIFPILLKMKRSRLTKGYSLVAFGALIVAWYTTLVIKFSLDLDPVAKDAMDVLIQMFTLASAGAGGSIIAADGDRNSTDREVQVERITITSDTQRIIDLHKLTLKQTGWIRTLCILAFLVLVGIVLNIVMRS